MEFLAVKHFRSGSNDFLEALKSLIQQRRFNVTHAINKELILLYHSIGAEVQGNNKSKAGK
jgi:hypothetical protein